MPESVSAPDWHWTLVRFHDLTPRYLLANYTKPILLDLLLDYVRGIFQGSQAIENAGTCLAERGELDPTFRGALILEDVISDGEVITIDQQWENRRIHGMRYLQSICTRPDWKNVKVGVAVEMGIPAEVILDFAQKHKIDRIVMSTHGRTGVNRWVYGSVADKVLRGADRTVVLVRAGSPIGPQATKSNAL